MRGSHNSAPRILASSTPIPGPGDSDEDKSETDSSQSSNTARRTNQSFPNNSSLPTTVSQAEPGRSYLVNPQSNPQAAPEGIPPEPDVLELSIPSVPTCRVATTRLAWTAVPWLVLGGVLVGVYFLEGQEPSIGTMILVGASQALVIAYFYVMTVVTDLWLIKRIAGGVEDVACAEGPASDAALSFNPCVAFVQRYVLAAFAQRDTGSSNSLRFLSQELRLWAKAPEAFVIVDPAGTILWCNDALPRALGYASGADLVGEDIRLLMPPPYSMQHGRLMRRYDRASPVKKVVGCTRPIPMTDKLGVIQTVDLTVEERVDPSDPATAVFVGRMVFHKGPDLSQQLQQRLKQKVDVVQACDEAQGRLESFVVIDAKGVVRFVNKSFAIMLGWTPEEMMGKNVSVLMADDVAAAHDTFLERYVSRADADPNRWPQSTVVGQGRDICMRCREGGYVRTWLAVHRLDVPSKEVKDCYFLGTALYMQGTSKAIRQRQGMLRSDHSLTPSSVSSSRSSRSSSLATAFSAGTGGSDSVHRKGGSASKVTRLSAPKASRLSGVLKKATVMLFDVHGLPGYTEDLLAHEYQSFLSHLSTFCAKSSAQIHSPVGDRVLVTLNLSANSTSQRSVAGSLMFNVLQGYYASKSHGHVQVYAAACITDCFVGAYGKHPLLVGEGVDLATCLLHVAAEARGKHPLIDSSLHEELQFIYDCRRVNTLTLHPKHKRARLVPVYEMVALKDLNEEEWMYQVDMRNREDPWEAWIACWSHLSNRDNTLPGQVESEALTAKGDIAEALHCLGQHLEKHDGDPFATWLLRVLRQPEQASPAETAGKLRYIAHFALAHDAAGRRAHGPNEPTSQPAVLSITT